jgi:hypothetical protein
MTVPWWLNGALEDAARTLTEQTDALVEAFAKRLGDSSSARASFCPSNRRTATNAGGRADHSQITSWVTVTNREESRVLLLKQVAARIGHRAAQKP